jgi:hypothetical protein
MTKLQQAPEADLHVSGIAGKKAASVIAQRTRGGSAKSNMPAKTTVIKIFIGEPSDRARKGSGFVFPEGELVEIIAR